MPKKLRASQAQFRTMCGKSLCKSTENEEAGKVQSCADVQRNTRNVCANVQKIDGKTHESTLKTHESVLYLINNAREVRYFCVKMVKNNEKNERNIYRMYMKCVESMCILYKKPYKKYSKKYTEIEIILHYCAK